VMMIVLLGIAKTTTEQVQENEREEYD